MPFILQRLINYSNYFPLLLFTRMKLSLASETVYVFSSRTFLLCLCLLQFDQNSIRVGRPGKCINGIREVMRLMAKCAHVHWPSLCTTCSAGITCCWRLIIYIMQLPRWSSSINCIKWQCLSFLPQSQRFDSLWVVVHDRDSTKTVQFIAFLFVHFLSCCRTLLK